MPEQPEQKQETVREACDRLRDAARNIMTIAADFTNDPRRVLCDLADRIEAAAERERRKECEQCIHDRVRDEEMKTRVEQMSPAEETDLTLFEMRRSAENGRLAIKENQQVRSALECYVDNTLAYANRLADSIARERRRAATKLSLAELHIKTLHKQFKHHGELE